MKLRGELLEYRPGIVRSKNANRKVVKTVKYAGLHCQPEPTGFSPVGILLVKGN